MSATLVILLTDWATWPCEPPRNFKAPHDSNLVMFHEILKYVDKPILHCYLSGITTKPVTDHSPKTCFDITKTTKQKPPSPIPSVGYKVHA